MTKEKSESTELEILAAAKVIFQQKGMDGARMQEIADKAKINKALLHYYYRSKQLLFEAVFSSAFSLLAPQLNSILNEESDLFDKIIKFTDNYISFVIKHPYLPNFVIQELNRNPAFVTKLRSRENFPTIDKFKLQVTIAIQKGIIKPIQAEQLFINIMSLNVFPFIAEPLLMALTDTDKESYNQLIQNRKTEISTFIINAIKM